MRLRSRFLLVLALGLLALASPLATAADVFVIKPYLQLGDAPASNSGDLALLWAGEDVDSGWSVEYRVGPDLAWKKAEGRPIRRVVSATVPPHRLYRASLTRLPPGSEFTYQIRKGNDVVFSASAKARKSAGQPYRFVAVGDIAQGSPAQKTIAERIVLEKPDFMMVTGDIVYGQGRVSEYRDRYWPVYNADETSPSIGGPLLRSTLTLAAPGNHDVANRNLGRYPDGLAYFLYWDQPLNGPKDGPFTIPLAGPDESQKAFLDSAGPSYPRMANFSFDYGNAHWLVLDANPYVDWRDPGLRGWVERDLAARQGCHLAVRLVPPPGVQLVEDPLRRSADAAGRRPVRSRQGRRRLQRPRPQLPAVVPVEVRRQPRLRRPDGPGTRTSSPASGPSTRPSTARTKTRPDGVIYLVTGAGGAGLYNPEQQDKPETWQSFTDKFISKIHSITVADVDGKTLTVRQVSAERGGARSVHRDEVTDRAGSGDRLRPCPPLMIASGFRTMGDHQDPPVGEEESFHDRPDLPPPFHHPGHGPRARLLRRSTGLGRRQAGDRREPPRPVRGRLRARLPRAQVQAIVEEAADQPPARPGLRHLRPLRAGHGEEAA